jgi:hypothetical protein
MKRTILALLLTVVPFAVFASGSAGTLTISSLEFDSVYGLVAVSGPSSWANPDGCAISSVVIIQASNTYYKDLLALALTASASGKTVNFYVSGCGSTAGGTAPIVQVESIN